MTLQLLLPRSRDKRAYRLRCRFKIEPRPSAERLDREKVRVAERFVSDMHRQGWENVGSYGFEMRGPFPMIVPAAIAIRRTPTARQMLPRVIRGDRFLDLGETPGVAIMPALADAEWWEYELAGVFVRDEILTERADLHEEGLGL